MGRRRMTEVEKVEAREARELKKRQEQEEFDRLNRHWIKMGLMPEHKEFDTSGPSREELKQINEGRRQAGLERVQAKLEREQARLEREQSSNLTTSTSCSKTPSSAQNRARGDELRPSRSVRPNATSVSDQAPSDNEISSDDGRGYTQCLEQQAQVVAGVAAGEWDVDLDPIPCNQNQANLAFDTSTRSRGEWLDRDESTTCSAEMDVTDHIYFDSSHRAQASPDDQAGRGDFATPQRRTVFERPYTDPVLAAPLSPVSTKKSTQLPPTREAMIEMSGPPTPSSMCSPRVARSSPIYTSTDTPVIRTPTTSSQPLNPSHSDLFLLTKGTTADDTLASSLPSTSPPRYWSLKIRINDVLRQQRLDFGTEDESRPADFASD